jgi:hypothetical protein
MRRVRRTRITERNKNALLNQLKTMILEDSVLLEYVTTGQRNRAFGRLLNKRLDSTNESLIDRFVDEDAMNITGFAINIIAKHYK